MLVRHCQALVRDSLGDFPAVLLLGARQVGKSTLAQQMVSQGVLDRYVTLDDISVIVRRNERAFLVACGD